MGLSRAANTTASTNQRDAAYRAFLELLARQGAFDALPVDASGTLCVNVPFCHDCFEAPLLLPFLVEHVLGRGLAQAISVFGCDLQPQPLWWPAWEAWAKHTLEPRVSLRLVQQNLAELRPPEAGLTLGIHPEVTNGGPWPSIITNVLRSCAPGGRCVFATFYEVEAQATVQLCQSLGATCEVSENPYYSGQPQGKIGTFLRFSVSASSINAALTSTVPSAAPTLASTACAPRASMAVRPASTSSAAPATGPALSANPPSMLDTVVQWVARRRAAPDQRDLAYSCFLKALAAWGVLERFGTGPLHVGAPFCQEFFEAPLLLPFLGEHLGSPEISVYGCDVQPQSFWWPAWREWTSHVLGPRFRLELRQQDLSLELPPPASLVLGVHPEVTKGGVWTSIMANVLRSCFPGGLCIFATFYVNEAEEVRKVCTSLGCASCDIRENPHYAGQPANLVGTFLRFVVLVRTSADAYNSGINTTTFVVHSGRYK